MDRVKLFSLLIGAYLACAAWSQTPDQAGFDAHSMRDLMKRLGVPGVSVAVIRDFKIHWAKAYGLADVSTGALADTDTLF